MQILNKKLCQESFFWVHVVSNLEEDILKNVWGFVHTMKVSEFQCCLDPVDVHCMELKQKQISSFVSFRRKKFMPV